MVFLYLCSPLGIFTLAGTSEQAKEEGRSFPLAAVRGRLCAKLFPVKVSGQAAAYLLGLC